MQHHVVSIVSDAAGISDYITNEIDSLVFRSEDPTALAERYGGVFYTKINSLRWETEPERFITDILRWIYFIRI